MTKTPDRPARPPAKPSRQRLDKGVLGGHADARGDFYYDELMTPQPDAIREYQRAQLLKPMKPAAKKKP